MRLLQPHIPESLPLVFSLAMLLRLFPSTFSYFSWFMPRNSSAFVLVDTKHFSYRQFWFMGNDMLHGRDSKHDRVLRLRKKQKKVAEWQVTARFFGLIWFLGSDRFVSRMFGMSQMLIFFRSGNLIGHRGPAKLVLCFFNCTIMIWWFSHSCVNPQVLKTSCEQSRQVSRHSTINHQITNCSAKQGWWGFLFSLCRLSGIYYLHATFLVFEYFHHSSPRTRRQ